MKIILTLSLLFVSISGFAQKVTLALNLQQDSTYYLVENATITVVEDINGTEQTVSTFISARVAHKVIAITDTIYQVEVEYISISMHVDAAGKKMDFNSEDKTDQSLPARIFATMLNKPFLMTITKTGKVLEIKNTDNLYLHMFDNFPQVTAAQQAQFKTQMEQSFGDKAVKSNFQDAFAMFPRGKVGPNDQWIENSRMESIIAIDMKTTYTLLEITDNAILVKGEAVIHNTGDPEYKMVKGFPARFMNVEGNSAVQIKLDKNIGWIIEAKTSKLVKGIMEIKDSPKVPGGLKFPMSIMADITLNGK